MVADTREQVNELNAAIRNRLVTDGRVDDVRVVTTRAGQRIGAGDRIATRRNDRDLEVANRDTWTVTAVGRRGGLLVTGTATGDVPRGDVTPAGARVRVLPADYVTEHVELAYASTAYGVQGDTVPAAHVVIGDQTGAASAYVGMTRGQLSNTAHLVAADVTEARAQWIAVFGRDRADLGPGHAPSWPLERPPATGRQPLPRGRSRRYRASPGPRRSGGDHPSPVEAPRRASVDEAASTGRPQARPPATGGELEDFGSHRWSAVTNRAQMAPSPVTEHSPPEPTGASHVRPPRPPRARTAHHHRGRRAAARSGGHPPVLAPPGHRSAQLPPRPPRPLPLRRPPQLDRCPARPGRSCPGRPSVTGPTHGGRCDPQIRLRLPEEQGVERKLASGRPRWSSRRIGAGHGCPSLKRGG